MSKQPLLLLKLDYTKAYYKISWLFLFEAKEAMGFEQTFIEMVKLLYRGVNIELCLNGTLSKPFQILRAMRLAPYLFLIVGEIMNIQFHVVGRASEVIIQYIDDTMQFIQGEEMYIQNSIKILDQICSISWLSINWNKSTTSWEHRRLPWPSWTYRHQWSWVLPQELSKLLRNLFGLELSSESIENFLIERTKKKLRFLYASRLHVVGQAIIVNYVIVESIFFFIIVRSGTMQAIKFKKLARFFLRVGREARAFVREPWYVMCQKQGCSDTCPLAQTTRLLVTPDRPSYLPTCYAW